MSFEDYISQLGVKRDEVERWCDEHGLSAYPPEIKVASYMKAVRGQTIPSYIAQYKPELEVPVSSLEIGVSAYIRVYVATDINKVSWVGCPVCKRKIQKGSITCSVHPSEEGVNCQIVTYLAGDTSGTIPVDVASWTQVGMGREIDDVDLSGKTVVFFGYVKDNGNFRASGIVKVFSGVEVGVKSATVAEKQPVVKMIAPTSTVAQSRVVEVQAQTAQKDVNIQETLNKFTKMLSILNAGMGEAEIAAWMKRNGVNMSVAEFIAALGDRVERDDKGLYWLVK